MGYSCAVSGRLTIVEVKQPSSSLNLFGVLSLPIHFESSIFTYRVSDKKRRIILSSSERLQTNIQKCYSPSKQLRHWNRSMKII